jgi:hypothetical protein
MSTLRSEPRLSELPPRPALKPVTAITRYTAVCRAESFPRGYLMRRPGI